MNNRSETFPESGVQIKDNLHKRFQVVNIISLSSGVEL